MNQDSWNNTVTTSEKEFSGVYEQQTKISEHSCETPVSFTNVPLVVAGDDDDSRSVVPAPSSINYFT